MATAERRQQLSFEAALARLEEIVRTLEKGEAPLDQSIELYQEGDRLKRHCEARLKDAQARIEQIAFGSDGQPAGVKPFDARLGVLDQALAMALQADRLPDTARSTGRGELPPSPAHARFPLRARAPRKTQLADVFSGGPWANL